MYLITGGAGFIGSHLVRKLLSIGHRVRILDNFSTGKRVNLNGIEDQIEIVRGDILDVRMVKQAMEGVEVVFHQAAIRSVPFSVEKPALVNRVNVEGTVNILISASDSGVRRVIYASSSSVYGHSNSLPNQEQLSPKPISPYAVSKLAGEFYCTAFTEVYGLETVILRYFNVFGPRQDPSSKYAAVIPKFIQKALRKEPLEIHGDGLQSRDFTYIDNVVEANVLASRAPEAVGKVINVAQGNTFSVLDIARSLEAILGRKLDLVHTSARAGDVRHTLADISLAARVLKYQPTVTFEDGMIWTVRHLEETL